ncbi:MAG: hypothetical protein U9R37_08705 [Campylobacterota bacterium]|nr:hypothetical protein [Campylobacterota bacterium]
MSQIDNDTDTFEDTYVLFDDGVDFDLNSIDSADDITESEDKLDKEALKAFQNEYLNSLREEYHNADVLLFDTLNDLIEESDDKEKLMAILDSL